MARSIPFARTQNPNNARMLWVFRFERIYGLVVSFSAKCVRVCVCVSCPRCIATHSRECVECDAYTAYACVRAASVLMIGLRSGKQFYRIFRFPFFMSPMSHTQNAAKRCISHTKTQSTANDEPRVLRFSILSLATATEQPNGSFLRFLAQKCLS